MDQYPITSGHWSVENAISSRHSSLQIMLLNKNHGLIVFDWFIGWRKFSLLYFERQDTIFVIGNQWWMEIEWFL